MTTVQPSLLLRRVLLADGLISGATGLLMLFATDWLSAFLELPRGLLLGAGASLLPFALGLFWLARCETLPRLAVWVVIGINALWVIDSIWLLVAGGLAPNLFGYAFVIAQAVAVALFAELQWFGLKRSQPVLA
ncbi:hypothetical protein [Zestomonas carbonaria]|uniref:Integral membrane protein n=1 Tax=Zestomonas carbonaria TaxID=2762745 RepID=A0A7U7I809_9GAMM|nr:hypothetical protein [Pseudomonas carbonaria]CAD5106646.1 hypothetical protein PSEWESI4_00913 [Pseudomonas carbonaria]